jgi:hypothetical protein
MLEGMLPDHDLVHWQMASAIVKHLTLGVSHVMAAAAKIR